ncbi:MAG: hypothetical protein EA403_05870 [Spirochaetaceae bacterium]|nr:MAG: hypothetical protein EA403_05870 [Spirochaetaceae bacterium]
MSKPASLPATTIPAEVPTVVLQDVAELIRAPLIKTNSSRGGTLFRLASIGDFPEFGFLPVPERTVRIQAGKDEVRRFVLEDHDVVMTMVGTIGRIGIIPEQREELWVPASNIVVIRFREKRLEQAIAFVAYMRSQHGRRLLQLLTHGRTIPIISKKAFARTPIPAMSPRLQKTVTAYSRTEALLFQKHREIARQIDELRDTYLQ